MPVVKPASLDKSPLSRDRIAAVRRAFHGRFNRRILQAMGSIQRYILLLTSSLILSGCAGAIEMVRDLARDLSDIDVSAITDLFGGSVELSEGQIAQLAVIPEARLLWQNGVEEGG